ncbi:MAG: NERD domain-containing protein [Magnetococcales bacterium]|nr:NERD domain-containing protein [Magnetococcales bacterium]NGZ25399.1 NERD domain-containing protein [Magnetococcales bacterium]
MGALLTLIFVLLLLHSAYKIITAPAPLTRAEMEQQKGNDGERKVLQALADLEITHILHDVYLKGNRNVNQIDIIARAGNSILVIEVKNWDCRLRCNKKGPWDVLDADGNVVEQRENPLHQNYGHTQTVKEFLQANGHENVVDNAIGLTISTGIGVSFEGYKPDNFLTLGEAIRRITKIAQQSFTTNSYDAWKTLKLKAIEDKQKLKNEHKYKINESDALEKQTQKCETSIALALNGNIVSETSLNEAMSRWPVSNKPQSRGTYQKIFIYFLSVMLALLVASYFTNKDLFDRIIIYFVYSVIAVPIASLMAGLYFMPRGEREEPNTKINQIMSKSASNVCVGKSSVLSSSCFPEVQKQADDDLQKSMFSFIKLRREGRQAGGCLTCGNTNCTCGDDAY